MLLSGQKGGFINTIANNKVNNMNSFLEGRKSGIFSSVFCSLFSNLNGLVINLCLEDFHLAWRVVGTSLAKVSIFMKNTNNFTRAGFESACCSNNIKASKFMIANASYIELSSSLLDDPHVRACKPPSFPINQSVLRKARFLWSNP